MKIHILYDFVDGPYGGGNQFLKAIRSEFQRLGVYTQEAEKADVYLFNGYPFADFSVVEHLHDIKQRFPRKVYLFRIDGPTYLIRGNHKYYDHLLKGICNAYMDGIIFQSEWSRLKNKEIIGTAARPEVIIHNAPDRRIFNLKTKRKFSTDRKTKIIATSWSSNIRKGFEVYRYLDNHLDWSRYEMTFVGNSPLQFKNIRWVKPQPSAVLAQMLRQHDIFLTASQNDPCSNSLLEALNCGLPALALNDGGHPELISSGGLLFDRMEEVPKKLAMLVDYYETFQGALPVYDIGQVTLNYLDFAKAVRKSCTNDKSPNQRNSLTLSFRYLQLRGYFQFYDFLMRMQRKLTRGR